jgi:hypothetical protein
MPLPQDPLALVPWMAGMFALADSGATALDAGGGGWPAGCAGGVVPVVELLGGSSNPAAPSIHMYGNSCKLMGAFRRRCVFCADMCC